MARKLDFLYSFLRYDILMYKEKKIENHPANK